MKIASKNFRPKLTAETVVVDVETRLDYTTAYDHPGFDKAFFDEINALIDSLKSQGPLKSMLAVMPQFDTPQVMYNLSSGIYPTASRFEFIKRRDRTSDKNYEIVCDLEAPISIDFKYKYFNELFDLTEAEQSRQ